MAEAAQSEPSQAKPSQAKACDAEPDRLPEWDLTDLYPGPDSPALHEAVAATAAAAAAFRQRHAGRLATLDGAGLGRAVAVFERLDEVRARILAYGDLLHAGDMRDPDVGRRYQTIREQATAIGADLLFLPLELNRLDEAALAGALAAPELARYRPWLRDLRALRPHQLEDRLERLLHEKQVAGRDAWVRLYDETLAGLDFPLDGETLTEAGILERLTSPDGAVRASAARVISDVLAGQARLFALITNTLAKDKAIEDGWRGHARPISARNLANRVEDAVVEALAEAVAGRYAALSHRYYRLKAGWLGVSQLNHWDRNAPLPGDDDHPVGWAEARRLVLDAYGAFSPRMEAIARRFFDRGWIDAPPRPGKASGAFSHPTVPSAHPYILLNYQGRIRDVMTLAHELGHGVHQVLAAGQGHLLAETPLTLAETASVFGEMLTFQALLARETEPARRRVLLAGKVEDMLNTVVRQIAFHCFECRLHAERRSGELTAERIGDLWMQVQGESLGPAVRLDDGYRVWWAGIPHFIHAPFYVYAYAFGDCLVNTLYAVYREAGEGFVETYLDMLAAGGARRHHELLAPFGLDARDPGFWRRGLGVIEGFIDELAVLDSAGGGPADGEGRG